MKLSPLFQKKINVLSNSKQNSHNYQNVQLGLYIAFVVNSVF